MEIDRKKEDRTNRQAFDQGERTSVRVFLKSRFWSHRLFQADLKC